ncbi:hypothetical protein [Geminocystis herdmanii]|uniref:hypothetical protein n=1 Tax=Geminocystis herdmanii TaxID=669359 RepID=UPI0003486EEA|nr:hypothetical protein [Geminocystis herdmanii]
MTSPRWRYRRLKALPTIDRFLAALCDRTSPILSLRGYEAISSKSIASSDQLMVKYHWKNLKC